MFTDIIEKIMNLLNGSNDPAAKNKKLIKDIKKDLKKNSKIYNVKKDEVTAQLAIFFYNIYKIVAPFSKMLDGLESSNELKRMVVEQYMSEMQLKVVGDLTSEEITKRLTSTKNVKLTTSKIQKEIITLISSFSNDLTNDINNSFSLMLIFKELACFNFYFLLKKFDSRLPENDFVYKPSFGDINSKYVGEDLKDFLEILAIINLSSNWKGIFTIFTKYKSSLKVDNKAWSKAIKSMNDIKNSNLFLNIVKIIDENPFYEVKASFSDISIVEDYIKSIREDAEEVLKGVIKQKQEQAVIKFVELVFGDISSVERNKFYTKHANITYEKKELDGYTYVDPMNYIRAYFLDYFKTETKPTIELLLIQGQWATHVASQEFSDAFHQLQEFLPKSIELDNELADDANTGTRIKAMLRKAGKDRIARNALDSEIKTVNAQAKKIADNSVKGFITIANIIKSVLEEFKAGKVEIILNWGDLQATQEDPIEETLLKTYKKLYYMTQLIQKSTKDI